MIGAIVCGALYAIVTPPKPIIKPVAGEAATRTLAYQQQIARPGETGTTSEQDTKQQQATVPSETPSPKPKPGDAAPAPKPQAAAPAQPKSQAPAPQQDAPSEMAGLPPDDEAYDPEQLPWQQRGQPYPPEMQGEGPYQPGMPDDGYGPGPGPGPMGAWPGEDGPPPGEPWPGESSDPNAWPAEESQEWVQVLVSGAGMHAAATEGAPMMFAFPYGRTLRVISRYGNWVEVTDPQSATTGWMKAQYLAPVAQPRPHQQAQPWYGDEPPRRRRGWFRGQGGGLADMINRALGGY